MSGPSAYDPPPMWPGLTPTWRLLWAQARTFHCQRVNGRAERLVMRAMDREWPPARLEALLTQLLERDQAPRDERQRHQGVPA